MAPRPMRIALVTPGFSADDADWCIPMMQNLARSLSRLHDVRVYTISYPHRSGDYTVKGVPVRSFGGGRIRPFRGIGENGPDTGGNRA